VAVVADRRNKEASRLRVTWIRSTIGHKAGARGTIQALGLHRLHQTVEVADTPENRGMLRRVAFLLKVEEPSASSTTEGGPAK
jgi:large subunit ribosomal protein L30